MEWTVVTVLTVLAGLVAAAVRPLLALNSTITRLASSVDALEKNIAGLAVKYDETRERVSDHELRLRVMENK